MKIKGRGIKLCACGIVKKVCQKHSPANFCLCKKLIATCDKCREHRGRCGCGISRSMCKLHGGHCLCICGSGHHHSRCTKCGSGSKLCKHNKRKTGCMICAREHETTGIRSEYSSESSEICIHAKARKVCVQCGGSHICTQCRLITTRTKSSMCSTCRRFNDGSVPLKFKEAAFKAYLDASIERGDVPKYFSADRQVMPGLDKLLYGAARPDFLWKLSDRFIVLEVDEFQHISSNYSCERRRELELLNIFGSTPVIFIRFNPDTFSTGSKSTRKKTDHENMTKRHEKVVSELKKAVEKENPVGFTFVKIFFNCGCLEEDGKYTCGFVHSNMYTDHEDFLIKHQM